MPWCNQSLNTENLSIAWKVPSRPFPISAPSLRGNRFLTFVIMDSFFYVLESHGNGIREYIILFVFLFFSSNVIFLGDSWRLVYTRLCTSVVGSFGFDKLSGVMTVPQSAYPFGLPKVVTPCFTPTGSVWPYSCSWHCQHLEFLLFGFPLRVLWVFGAPLCLFGGCDGPEKMLPLPNDRYGAQGLWHPSSAPAVSGSSELEDF